MKLFKNLFLRIKSETHTYKLNRIDFYLENILRPIEYTPLSNDEIILEYGVELASIKIVKRKNEVLYTVNEPPLPENIRNTIIQIIHKYIKDINVNPNENLGNKILTELYKEDKDTDTSKFMYAIEYYINKLLSGYGVLYPLVNDDYVEEISCEAPNIPVAVYHSLLSEYKWLNTNIVLDQLSLNNLVLMLSKKAGKYLSIAFPYAEGLTEEGHRVAITLGHEISYRGSSFVLRRKPSRILTITDLIKNNTISILEAAYMMYILEYNPFIIITGSVATGKTTLLRAILTLLPDNVKIITIEDTPELQLPHTHWDPLITRKLLGGLFNTKIDVYDLARFALRRRGDYLIIGEVRGEEARVLAQASVLGYGVLTTFHADSVQSALSRLTLPPISLDERVKSNIWLIVHLRRAYRKGQGYIRRVSEISEPLNASSSLNRVFFWDENEDKHYPDSFDILIENSIVLKRILKNKNVNKEKIREELERRLSFLKYLIDNNINTQKEVLSNVTNFYNRMVRI